MFLINDEPRSLSVAEYELTCTILPYLFRHDSKDTKYLNYDFHKCVCHSDGWRDLNVDLQPSKDILNAFKQVKENALGSDSRVYSLKYYYIRMISH
jgi:hypothetical protein